ncbi:MAG TPA: ribosome maturation factor RimM [Actinomycetota bacterium]|nr:ribosome maturation factor RimM [Actinomycetota bacterium]
MTEQGPRWIAVGRINRPHGIKGEVVVQPLSEVEMRFAAGSRLYRQEDEGDALTVAEARPYRGRLLVTFEGVRDRNAAEAMAGAFLFVPSSSAPHLPEDEYWTHELVGCDVLTDEGRALGSIREIIHTPANDVWVAQAEEGETLIPALKDVVKDVDLPARRVIVREVSGLTGP